VTTTATGPNGKTTTSDQTYTKTSNGYSQTGTITGPNSKTSTDTRNVSYIDSNGVITRTATGSVTGLNGQTATGGNTETYTKTYTPATPPNTD